MSLKMPSLAKITVFVTWASSVVATQPWLNTSLPYEERLQSFLAQLNDTQKFAMVQGDTVVRPHPSPSSPPFLILRAHKAETLSYLLTTKPPA